MLNPRSFCGFPHQAFNITVKFTHITLNSTSFQSSYHSKVHITQSFTSLQKSTSDRYPHHSRLQTSDSSPPHSTMASQLPLELWSHILHQLDDEYTLWVTCRQVCHFFRVEAEREFALNRLRSVSLIWDFTFKHEQFTHWLRIQSAGTCGLVRDQSESSSSSSSSSSGGDDSGVLGSRTKAKFKFTLHNAVAPTYVGPVLTEAQQQHQVLRDVKTAFSYRDASSVKLATGHWREGHYRAVLGYYSNDVPLPGLVVDLESQTLVFDWVAFARGFFRDVGFVRERNREMRPFGERVQGALDTLFAEGDAAEVGRKVVGGKLDLVGEQDCFYFQEAYVRRLRRTNPAGLRRLDRVGDGGGGVKLRKRVAKHLASLRKEWYLSALEKYCGERGIVLSR